MANWKECLPFKCFVVISFFLHDVFFLIHLAGLGKQNFRYFVVDGKTSLKF